LETAAVGRTPRATSCRPTVVELVVLSSRVGGTERFLGSRGQRCHSSFNSLFNPFYPSISHSI
jgi:hypothetical protein